MDHSQIESMGQVLRKDELGREYVEAYEVRIPSY